MMSAPEICTAPLDGPPPTSPAADPSPSNMAVPGAQPEDQDVPKDLNQLTTNDVLLEISGKLDAVVKNLGSLSHKTDKRDSESTDTSDDEDSGSSNAGNDDSDGLPWPMPVSAKVTMCNFEQYKTVSATEHTRCGIEALLWSPTLKSDIENFTTSWKEPFDKKDNHVRDYHVQRAKSLDISDVKILDLFPPHETWIQEVRVNSEAVLSVLERVGYKDDIFQRGTRIFRRPFRYFFEYHDKVWEELHQIEASASLSSEHQDFDSSSVRTAEELRSYFEFVEKYIMPKYRELQDDEFAKTQKIHFDDLYFMFRPGELLYQPASSTRSSGLRGLSAQQRSTGEQEIVRLKYLKREENDDSFDPYRIDDKLEANSYYIEFDGERYGAVTYKDLEISRYYEARHITELPFYPARFLNNWEKVLAEAETQGRRTVALLSGGAQHAHYSGWTMISGPLGDELEDANRDSVRSPEHIESDIIVDCEEAFKVNPRWKPRINRMDPLSVSLEIETDSVPLVKLSTSPNEHSIHNEKFVEDDRIHFHLWNKFLLTDMFCKEDVDSPSPVRPEDLALLPRGMVAYSLWNRKFVHIDSYYVNKRTGEGQEGQSFQQLQVDQRSKDVIESLLYNHFNDMKAEKAGIVVESQDLIRGKGRGVSILLHGKPGVGKTATAEAVAEKWQRPLFPITCGDLGYEADQVEKSLNEIFRLAHLWGCVLLLDEADIFITQRTNQELQRNALVSVFLRMLEYYNGILFLTTNRTGVLDEAIKSRIHLHLGFDDLNEHQTVEIFKNNISRLRARDQQRTEAMTGHRALMIDEEGIIKFARHHYQTHSTGMGRWNGRQIRNAFVVASSLANFQAEKKMPGWQPQLRVEHFNTVLDATLDYDRYRQSILMKSDDAAAFDRMERPEPVATPPLSATTYGVVQNGASFPWQQQQQSQQSQHLGSPLGMQYGGAAGAAAAYAAMPSGAGSPSHNPGFTHNRTPIPEQTQAGLYPGQFTLQQGQQLAQNTHEQGQVYMQQHPQQGFETSTTAQGQGHTNLGGTSTLRSGVVDPVYAGNTAISPGRWPSSQDQAPPSHMQYGGVEGVHGRATSGGP